MKDEILFIDDEECIRQIAARILEKDDFHVTTLDSGEGAEAFRQAAGMDHIVLRREGVGHGAMVTPGSGGSQLIT